jgi:FkbM family methyltransferase
MKLPFIKSAKSVRNAPYSLLYWLRRYQSKQRHMNSSLAKKSLSCTIAYNEFGTYCVPLSAQKRPAAQKVLQGMVYEPQTISFIQSQHQGKDIIHAGTFFGDFLPALSQSCTETQKIWAFEPNPESYSCAEITIKLNRINNVNITHAGLGAEEKKGSFRTHNEEGVALGGGSHFSFEQNLHEEGLSIPITTIDSRIPTERDIGIIQLDVEGFEVTALQGATKTIARCHPILILEQFPSTDITKNEWFKTYILNNGYTLHTKVHENLVFVHQHKNSEIQ